MAQAASATPASNTATTENVAGSRTGTPKTRRIPERQWSNQHRVHHAEDGGMSGDGQGDGQYHRGREQRRPAHHAGGVANVF